MTERAVFVVDWDGTCVEEIWPGMGDWLPGAVDALRELSARGKTVIYSVRCCLLSMDCSPRDLREVAAEVFAIRRKLDEAGLHHIEIYPPNKGKPPGEFYVDDRAVTFRGDWAAALSEIRRRQEQANA